MALSNLHFIPNFETGIASVTVDGVEKTLSFEPLKKHWDYAKPKEIEGGHIQYFGDYVLGFLLIADGQGGVVFIWDPNKNELIHLSDGSYSVAVTADESFVYALSENTGWGSSGDVLISRVSRGIINAFNEGEVFTCPDPIPMNDFTGDFEGIQIAVQDYKLTVQINGKQYCSKMIRE